MVLDHSGNRLGALVHVGLVFILHKYRPEFTEDLEDQVFIDRFGDP